MSLEGGRGGEGRGGGGEGSPPSHFGDIFFNISYTRRYVGVIIYITMTSRIT